jgi:hypothetical protein
LIGCEEQISDLSMSILNSNFDSDLTLELSLSERISEKSLVFQSEVLELVHQKCMNL